MRPRSITPPASMVHGADRLLPSGTGMVMIGAASLLFWGLIVGIAVTV